MVETKNVTGLLVKRGLISGVWNCVKMEQLTTFVFVEYFPIRCTRLNKQG